MALSFTTRIFATGDGFTYAGNDQRLTVSAVSSGVGGASNPLATGSGVRPGSGNPMQVTVSSGLSVTVNTGYAQIQGSSAANAGVYTVTLDSVPTLTCNAADTVNPRIDSVCVTVTDLGTSSSTSEVQIITGTPSASPAAPSLPADSLLLCNITVPANATTLTSGNLSDQRVFYTTAGGVTQVLSSAFYPTTGEPGEWVYDHAANRFRMTNGSGTSAPRVAAFPPVQAGPNSVTGGGSAVTIVSQTITVDGSTSVKCVLTWGYIVTSSTGAGNGCTLAALRGSTNVGAITKYCTGTNSFIDGGSMIYVDNTPAAGTYTYSFTVQNQGAGNFAPHNAFGYWEAQSP